MASAPTVCQNCERDADWETFCAQCEQMYCNDCSLYHRGVKSTRKHILLDVSHRETDLTQSSIDIKCGNEYCGESAVGLCIDCEQLFCDTCTTQHFGLKATKDHTIIAAKALEPSGDAQSRMEYSMSHETRSNLSCAQVKVYRGIYEGIYANDFAASAPGEKEIARIRGIAIISDRKSYRIVVADYKNRNLKVYNMNCQLVASVNLKEDPRGIVAISNDQVAVTIADKRQIRFFKVETKKVQLQKGKTIELNDKPFSIAFNKEHFAVETGEGDDGAIRILHVSGRQCCVIPGNTRSFGQFTGNTIRLELDFSKESVFVVDVANSAVHCVNFKKCTMNWSVKMTTPRGIALCADTLFVASVSENKIFQLSGTDGIVCSFLDEHHRIKIPRYIAYNSEFEVLASEIDTSHVRIYKINRPQTKTEIDTNF